MAKRLFLVAVFLLLSALTANKASAFGVSPPFVNADKLLKGSRHETTIFLVQGQPKEDLEVRAVFDVPDKILGWFSVDKGGQFIIPAGVQQFPIKVIIKVPDDIDLGVYKGYLRINTVPKRKEGEQVNIAIGARIDINLTVGEGAYSDFAIRKLDILDIEEGRPPRIVVTLENIGNVPVEPERATLDLLDKYGNIRLGFAQNDKFPETPPFETKTFVLDFPIDLKLGIGEYWAEAQIYRDGQIVKSLKTVFNVIERKNQYTVLGGIGIVLVLLSVVFIFKKRVLRRNA